MKESIGAFANFTTRAVRAALCCVALAAAANAAGAVELGHGVQKVVRTVAEDGTETTQLVAADRVVPGDELVYTIAFENTGSETVDAGSVVITNPIPAELEYLEGTAAGEGTEITYSVDGGRTFAPPDALTVTVDGTTAIAPASAYTTIRWVFASALEPGGSGRVSFHARLE